MGAAGYSLLEILWRGYTHWTMGVTGGLCLSTLYRVSEAVKHWRTGTRCVLGSAIITGYELVVGWLVNLKLGWDIWDYSDLPLPGTNLPFIQHHLVFAVHPHLQPLLSFAAASPAVKIFYVLRKSSRRGNLQLLFVFPISLNLSGGPWALPGPPPAPSPALPGYPPFPPWFPPCRS